MNINDKRDTKRRKTLLGGIVYGGIQETWECRIIDLSKTGVKLKVPVPYEVGTKVFLRITNLEGIHLCKTVWATGDFTGLKFLKSSGVNDRQFYKNFYLLNSTHHMVYNEEIQSRISAGIR